MGVRWRAKIEIRGVNPFVRVSRERVRRIRADRRGPIPVRMSVNGKPSPPYRTNLMPTGDGSCYLYLNGIVRAASDTKVGDLVEVRAEFDPEYRGGPVHPMPPAFARGLRSNANARKAWERLPASGRKEIVRYLAALHSTEAVARNVERALKVLGGERGRFLGRDWN